MFQLFIGLMILLFFVLYTRPCPPPARGLSVDTSTDAFETLMKEIAQNTHFAQIYTATKGSLKFKVKFVPPPKSRQQRLGARANDKWQLIENLKQTGCTGTSVCNWLLLPPQRLTSTDISDFARKYPKSVPELYDEMRKALEQLKGDAWVYTHGYGEDYLHIRFETSTTPKYPIGQAPQ